jgi:hypothetical protein
MTKGGSLWPLLQQAGNPEVLVLPLIIDLARNIANLSRIGGPKNLVVPSVTGQPLPNALLDFVNTFARQRLSKYKDRLGLRHGEAHVAKKGQRFDVDAWLRSTIILFKMAQSEDIGPRKKQLDIVSRYLLRKGRWHDPTGVGEEQIKDWRKQNRLRKYIFKRDLALRITALAIPADLEQQTLSEQIAFLKALGPRAKNLYEGQMDEKFPAEAFWLLFDFSLHTDAELVKLLEALKPFRQESLGYRLCALAAAFLPALIETQDQNPEIFSVLYEPEKFDAIAEAVNRTSPVLSSGPRSVCLSAMILPVEGAEKTTKALISFEDHLMAEAKAYELKK